MAKMNITKLCECGCGEYISLEATRFKHGHNSRVEHPMERHKMSQSREHETWRNIKGRCNNHNNDDFPLYGGRGIRVCSKWENSFEAFFKDMGKRPKGKSIDRKDNDGHYILDNCQFIEMIENRKKANFNLQKNIFIYNINTKT